MKTHTIRTLVASSLASIGLLLAANASADRAAGDSGSGHDRDRAAEHPKARGERGEHGAKASRDKRRSKAERDERRSKTGRDRRSAERDEPSSKAEHPPHGSRQHRGKKKGHLKQASKRFARADRNADGFLTSDEVGARRWERIHRADANGDAKVSRAELHEALAKMGGPRGRHGHQDRRGAHGASQAQPNGSRTKS